MFALSQCVLLQLGYQHPYAAEFIGEPNVFSVTMDNLTEVDEVVRRALKALNEGKVSYSRASGVCAIL